MTHLARKKQLEGKGMPQPPSNPAPLPLLFSAPQSSFLTACCIRYRPLVSQPLLLRNWHLLRIGSWFIILTSNRSKTSEGGTGASRSLWTRACL